MAIWSSVPTTRRTVLQEVKHLVRMGASVILLHERSKQPVGNDWSNKPVATFEQLTRQYRDGMNVGVRLGKWSVIDGLYLHVIDVDIRDPDKADEAFEELDRLFPGYDLWKFPCVRSGSGGESRHFYFVTDKAFPGRKLARSEHKVAGKNQQEWEIELFGTGKQVALPPSIHRISGKEYRWEVEFDPTADLPHIDQALIQELVFPVEEGVEHDTDKLGVSYEEVEEALKHLDFNYWCDDRDGWIRLGMALAHEFDGEKAAFEVWCDFSKQSPKFDREKTWDQWKSFRHKTSRPVRMATILKSANESRRDAEFRALPGEFEDIEVSDEPEPLDPDDLIDAFEDLEEPDEPEEAESAPADGKIKVKGVPEHLLRVPGVLQKLVDYYNATAIRPQPQFAVQTALAFGSVVLGRMWSTGEENNYTSLYFMNVAPTAAGKEHIRKVIGRSLDASRLNALMGPKGYASEPAIIGRLKQQPRHITVTDEMGRYIGSARKSGNANKLDAQTLLMEIFGNVDDVLRGISYSTRGMNEAQIKDMMETEIVRPALTLVGMTTPATLYEAIGAMDVKDGFLNRFIIVQSVVGRLRRRRGLRIPQVPEEIAKWAKEHAFAHGGSEEDDDRTLIDPKFVPDPVVVPFTAAAIKMLEEIGDEVDAQIGEAEAYGMAELYGRTQEIAQRLALIIARSEGSDTVKVPHLEWAWDYVRFYHGQMVELFRKNLGKSEDEAIADEIVTFLKKRGSKGATGGEIAQHVRSFRALDPEKRRPNLLLRVQTDFGVKHVENEGRGPKSKRYFAPKR